MPLINKIRTSEKHHHSKPLGQREDGDATIVLTGSTGNLGCYLLDRLVQQLDAATIYCLGRSSDAETRQPQLLSARGLQTTIPHPRVHFYQCHLTEPRLGLETDLADKIASSATHYVHCAWPVDWNRSFSSFRPAVEGVDGLLRFMIAETPRAKLFFISSIATVGNWGAVPGSQLRVPEEELDDWKTARFGYGQSKLVAERVIAHAAKHSRLDVSICRIGQIAGPVDDGAKGVWPKLEWLPSLIASSKYLQAIPDSLGPLTDVDWIPVDRLTEMLTELILAPTASPSTKYYHLVNPCRQSWDSLLEPLKMALPAAAVVSLPRWADLLEQSETKTFDVRLNPAIKLLPFFMDLADKSICLPKARSATLSVKHTLRCCPTLSVIEPVSVDWMRLWIRQILNSE